jgi:SAM-dependent methyltransferase
MKRTDTSWQNVSEWYGKAVGKEGNYYHQHIVLPNSLRLLDLKNDSSLLDLACGQGVLARQLPPGIYYAGVDASPDLIKQAKQLDNNRNHIYGVADVSKNLHVQKRDFSHAALILALQNIEDHDGVIKNARKHLRTAGKLLVVLNHPHFRIPRQTSWGIDHQKQSQYRRVDMYMTPLKIPIRTNPGQGEKSASTWSYHFPLSHYAGLLSENGFVIERLEEWTSDRQSVGRWAKMENRARMEFPLFMAILARRD